MSGFGAKDRIMHRFFTVFSVAALLLVGTVAMAQEHATAAPHDQEWVQQKVQVCASCHGKNGVSTNPAFPTIAGQYESYLYHSLKSYKDGTRKNAIMGAQVGSLTDGQLRALAAHFAQQESPLHTPSFNVE